MDRINIPQKLIPFIQKYKYVALVLLLGLVLLAIPSRSQDTDTPAATEAAEQPSENISTQDELAAILSKIEGAGKVEVMLTVEAGAETVYQSDQSGASDADSSSAQYDTVIITDAERAQAGLIRQVNPEQYLGAIIVCEGADSPAVRLAIVEAVSKVTGMGADRISVLKMK